MFQYVHQIIANFVWLLFGAGQIVNNGFIKDISLQEKTVLHCNAIWIQTAETQQSPGTGAFMHYLQR